MTRRFLMLAGAAALLAAPAVLAVSTTPAGPSYKVTKRIAVGGDGGWDYLTCDGQAHRLYLSRGSHVQVVDLDKGTVAGDIADTPGVHGIALDSRDGRGFTSNGGDNTVTVFDLKTLKTITKVPVGTGPDAILYDPASQRVFTFNGRSGDSTAIDAATAKVAGTIALGGRPEFAVPDGRGHVYVNIEDKSEVAQLDSKTLKLLNHWSLAPGDGPSGIAIDRRNRRIFSVCGNQMMTVMDADTGKIVATPAIGHGPDAAGFDASAGVAFSSNGEGTLTVVKEVDPDTYQVAQTVTTEPGARTMALDRRTHTVYLVTAKPDPTPPPAGTQRRGRRFLPNSFVVLVVERQGGATD